jgi:outer membrane lipoprotein-sorting protein
MKQWINGLFLASLFMAANAVAQDSDDKTPTVDEIVAKANKTAYYQGLDGKSKVQMTITDKQGRTRNREFVILRKNTLGTDDQKYFVYFQAPADVRRMVFMVHKHAAFDKDDDRWLYLPNLDLVRRIAAGDKRTSFVGSDFLYEDVSGRSLLEDTHTLLRTTDQFYVIKSVPKKPDAVEFSYFLVSIDKKTSMPMKMEYFEKDDTLFRVIESQKLEMIKATEDGKEVEYPTVTRSVVKDIKSGSTTEMVFSDVQYNLGLTDDIFTERFLKRPPREAMR